MKSTVHTLILASAVIAAVALATTAAKAETTLKVPFSFTVAGKTLPAGEYSVRKDNGNIVTLRSLEARKSFTWIAGPGEPNPTDNHIVLKFDEAGETHALRSIQYGAVVTSRLDRKAIDNAKESVKHAQGQ